TWWRAWSRSWRTARRRRRPEGTAPEEQDMRRVVVTGIGVVSALGPGRAAFWGSLGHGRPGIGPIGAVERNQFRFHTGARVRGFKRADHVDERAVASLDRFAQFAAVAAREAVRDARLEWTPELRARAAVVTGTCTGGQTCEDEGFVELYVRQRGRVHPLTVP